MTRICCACDRASQKSLSAEHASPWAWSPATTGKIFCSFCALCLPAGKAQCAETAKENHAEAQFNKLLTGQRTRSVRGRCALFHRSQRTQRGLLRLGQAPDSYDIE